MKRRRYKVRMSRTDRMFYKIERERKLQEQRGRCFYCKKKITIKEATTDHVVPLSETSRRHAPSNAVVCCSTCNSNKGNKKTYTPKELIPGTIDHFMRQMFNRIDHRVMRARYNLSMKNYGNFKNWKRHYENGSAV